MGKLLAGIMMNHKSEDEILSISIIDGNGKVLLDTLIKPEYHSKWTEAEKINHISPEIVKDKPTIKELRPILLSTFINCKLLVAYNMAFDIKFLLPALGIDDIEYLDFDTKCCMLKFAKVYGEYSEYFGNYKWQSLSTAMEYYNLEWQGLAHNSLADTYACRDIWYAMLADEEVNFKRSENND